MKSYFKSSEIDHQWAHELAPRGKCPGHEHFEGVSFYSYNTEIARILKRNGHKAYLLNVTSYSVTTSSHQNGVLRAIPEGELIFRISDTGRGCSLGFSSDKQTGATLFDYAIKSAAEASASIPRARLQWKKDSLAGEQASWLKQAEQVSGFFGLRRKVDAKAVERLSARVAADEKRKAVESKERQARLEKEARETVDRWMAGESVQFPYSVERVYLRAILPDPAHGRMQVLETSRGVVVPLPEAKRAFKFAQKVRAAGWRRNGDTFKVGDFQLDAVNEQGIVAGCHRIDWQTAETFAKAQGWI